MSNSSPVLEAVVSDVWDSPHQTHCASFAAAFQSRWTGCTTFCVRSDDTSTECVASCDPDSYEPVNTADGASGIWIDSHDVAVVDSYACAKSALFELPDNWNNFDQLLVEYCAFQNSTLCQPSVNSTRIWSIRCTKEHDLTKSATIDELRTILREVPERIVVVLWSGIPCTGGTQTQRGNSRLFNFKHIMMCHWSLFKKLLSNLLLLIDCVLVKCGHVCIEWPLTCAYWKLSVIEKLLESPLRLQSFYLHGCAYGLKVESGVHEGKFLQKPWKIITTMPDLESILSRKCPKNHEHIGIHGNLTAGSSRYPPRNGRHDSLSCFAL